MSCDDKTRLVAGEVDQLRPFLTLVVDRRRTLWEALYQYPGTGDYWEETTEGRYDYPVLTKVTKEYAEEKYGPLP